MNSYRTTTRFVFSNLFSVAIALLLLTGLAAEDKPKRNPNKSQSKRATTSVESALQAPSRLTFDETKRITLGELFHQVAKEHGVQIRIDKNLASLLALGREEMLVAEGAIPGANKIESAYNTASKISIPFPIQIASVNTASNHIASSPVQEIQSGYPQPTYSPYAGNINQSGIATPQPVPTIQPSAPTYSFTPNATSTAPQPTYLTEPDQETQPRQIGTIRAHKPVAVETEESTEPQVVEELEENLQLSSRMIEMLLDTEITTVGLDHSNATLESVLSHALDHVTTLLDALNIEEGMPLPISSTHAYDLTLLVEKDHVLVTTIAAANLRKTTKVYSVTGLGEVDAETLATVITKTIRPWSWRTQINSLVEQVSAEWPDSISIPKIKIDLTGVNTSEGSSDTASDSTEVDLASLKAMGQLLSSGTIATAHAMISGAEMMHHADPPTADIETLPGMLIITQSQGAHKEIDDLITQLKSVNDDSE